MYHHTPILLHPTRLTTCQRLRNLARRLSIQLLDMFHSPSWMALACRSWRAYVFAVGEGRHTYVHSKLLQASAVPKTSTRKMRHKVINKTRKYLQNTYKDLLADE